MKRDPQAAIAALEKLLVCCSTVETVIRDGRSFEQTFSAAEFRDAWIAARLRYERFAKPIGEIIGSLRASGYGEFLQPLQAANYLAPRSQIAPDGPPQGRVPNTITENWISLVGVRELADEARRCIQIVKKDNGHTDVNHPNETGWDAATEARNKWYYDQAMDGVAWEQIKRNQTTGNGFLDTWNLVENGNGAKKAAYAYAKRHGVDEPPTRQPGRRGSH